MKARRKSSHIITLAGILCLSVPLLIGGLMGCRQQAEPVQGTDKGHGEALSQNPVVYVEAVFSGYKPEQITLEPGVPTDIVFTRTTDSTCLEKVQIPDLGVEPTFLPRDEPVRITVTAEEEGEFVFTCGMNMLSGTILVKST